MEIFISWSGERSGKLAESLGDWIPNVIQVVKTWCSESDLEKGSRWLKEISEKLNSTNFGLICLTPENMSEPWILFEAGALSKSLDDTKVCPILFNFESADLKGPLSQFQTTRIVKDDMLKLLQTINNCLPTNKLTDKQLEDTFELWWPKLEDKVKTIPEPTTKTKTQRTERELLEEVLRIARNLERQSSPVDLNAANEILATLSPREEKVLRMKFGIGEERIYSHEEIAAFFGVSADKIKETEIRALRRLRRPGRVGYFEGKL